MGIVQAVPGRTDHVYHVGVDHREIGEAARRDAQDAQVVVQRGRAALYRNAFLFVVHFRHFLKMLFLKCEAGLGNQFQTKWAIVNPESFLRLENWGGAVQTNTTSDFSGMSSLVQRRKM